MLKRVLIAVGVVIAGFVAYVAMLPSTFRMERSTIVVASAAGTFAEINDLQRWQAWSPWAKLDPNAKTKFEGPASGEGAVFHWAGNEQVGEGRMTMVESRPDERVGLRVDFVKPFAGTNNSEFTLKADGPRTIVTWVISGEHGFIERAICLFMNPDRMIGTPMEQGLANLKQIVEGKAA